MATLRDRLQQPVPSLPLAIFRVGFGLLMFVATVRFVANGWVQTQYVAPTFHFTFVGFGWVRPLPGDGMTVVFVLMALGALGIAAGLFYRASVVAFFVLFTYVELLDQTYYLNHYYLIALLSFLMIWLPLNCRWSLDARRDPRLYAATVPAWTIAAVRLQFGLVYIFAGVAKLNSDWLLHGLPLAIWLPPLRDLPLVGGLLAQRETALVMSWAGAIFDLTIPIWLGWRRTRPFAYVVAAGFHILTGVLFPVIGMFPLIMTVLTLVFFDERDWRWLMRARLSLPDTTTPSARATTRWVVPLLAVFFAIQVLLPFRSLLYPGDVLWTEEGFRLSWRVMLVDKAGSATFHVRDSASGRTWTVFPRQYLTRLQERQMAFQPDMILQFAHYVEALAREQGYGDVEVRAEVYVAFNGRRSRLLIDPDVDLTQTPPSFLHKPWILPL
ncbi:MAG: HTTM domain-containing protein [Anaerolineae bacterium]|nr:HTTM domain-containing protein [Anaerolineae bacterium]